MRTVTRDQINSWNPCYWPWEIDRACNGAEVMALQEVLNLSIPWDDQLWVLLHAITDEERLAFARGCAERARGYADACGSTRADAAAYAARGCAARVPLFRIDGHLSAGFAARYADRAAVSAHVAPQEHGAQIEHLREIITAN